MNNRIINSVEKRVKYWWISLLVGILVTVVGIWSLVTPVNTLIAITYVFVTALILIGIFNIILAVSNRNYINGWGWHLAGGILELLMGIILLILPTLSVTTILIFLIGFWMLFRSGTGIAESCELQMMGVKGWGWLLALSILSLLFSFLFFISPVFGGMFTVIYVGISLIFYGIFNIFLAFKLRKMKEIN